MKASRSRVACTTFPFTGLPLRQAFDRVAELGFSLVELAVHYVPEWGHLTPAGIARDPILALESLEDAQRRSGVRLAAMTITTQPFVLAERGEFEAACKLARRAGAATVTIRGTGRDELLEVRRLRDFAAVAADQGVVPCLETRSDSPFVQPAFAAGTAEAVEGLRLTLDTGHLLCAGLTQDTWGPLVPLTGHVHVRDAGLDAGRFQMPFGSGHLDLARLLTDLAGAGYAGLFTAEYMGRRPEDLVPFDSEPELRKTREALERGLAGGA